MSIIGDQLRKSMSSLAGETVTNRKWLILTGGIVSAGLGGYLLYRSLKSRPCSASDQPTCSSNKHESSAENSNPTIDDAFAEAKRIKLEGNKLFSEKKYTEAIEKYTKAIEICPRDQPVDFATLYQNRAATYEKLNDYEKVFEDCSKALELNKSYTKASFRRGAAAEKLGDLKQATHDFIKCCVLEQFSRQEPAQRASKCVKEYSVKLATLLMQSRDPSKLLPWSKTVVKATLRAFGSDPIFLQYSPYAPNSEMNAAEKGDYIDLRTQIRQLIKDGDYESVLNLCTKYVQDNDQQRSTQFYECLLIKSLLYNLCGALDRARVDATKVLDLLPLHAEGDQVLDEKATQELMCAARIMLGFADHLSSNVKESLEHLAEAEKLSPENADVHSLRGQIKSLHDMPSEAFLPDFHRAIELRPDFVHYKVQMLASMSKSATEQQNTMMMSGLMNQVKELVVRNPTSLDANMFHAQFMIELEQYPEAARHLEVAYKLDPSAADIIAQKGLLEMFQGTLESGLNLLNRALEVDPYCLMALEILAQHYSKISDVPKMMDCFEKALQVARSEAEVAHFISLRETALANQQVLEDIVVRGM